MNKKQISLALVLHSHADICMFCCVWYQDIVNDHLLFCRCFVCCYMQSSSAVLHEGARGHNTVHRPVRCLPQDHQWCLAALHHHCTAGESSWWTGGSAWRAGRHTTKTISYSCINRLHHITFTHPLLVTKSAHPDWSAEPTPSVKSIWAFYSSWLFAY